MLTLAALPDGRLASGSYDKMVRVWDLVSGSCVHVLEGHEEVSEGDGCIVYILYVLIMRRLDLRT